MKNFELETQKYINFKALLAEVREIKLDAISKEEQKKIECFLLIPFFLIDTAKNVTLLKKKDVKIKKRRNEVILKIVTEFQTYYIMIKKHSALYEEIFNNHILKIKDDEFLFLLGKSVKCRYQAFNTLLKKSYPISLSGSNSDIEIYQKHPYKTLKTAISETTDFVQIIPYKAEAFLKLTQGNATVS